MLIIKESRLYKYGSSLYYFVSFLKVFNYLKIECSKKEEEEEHGGRLATTSVYANIHLRPHKANPTKNAALLCISKWKGIIPQATQIQKIHSLTIHSHSFIHPLSLGICRKYSANLSGCHFLYKRHISLQTAICSCSGHPFLYWDDFAQIAAATLLHLPSVASSPAHEITAIAARLSPAVLQELQRALESRRLFLRVLLPNIASTYFESSTLGIVFPNKNLQRSPQLWVQPPLTSKRENSFLLRKFWFIPVRGWGCWTRPCRSNLACCPFLYGLQAKNDLCIFIWLRK